MSNPTLTETLAAHGYSHAKGNPNRNGRDIRDVNGVVIGSLTSDEGWAWVNSGFPVLPDGSIDREAIECATKGGHFQDNQDRCHRCGIEVSK